MPSFTTAVADLRALGPVFEALVAVPEPVEELLRSSGRPVPQPIRVSALIDTGASQSVIQAGLAEQLHLNPVGMAAIHTASAADVPCALYDVRLALPSNVVAGLVAVETSLAGQSIQVLIGRDVLQQGVLVYVGYTGTFTFSI